MSAIRHTIRYDKIRYGKLTCVQKLTRWPALSSARHRIDKIRKTKNSNHAVMSLSSTTLLPTKFVVQREHSVRCVCLCGRTITSELNDHSLGYFAQPLTSTLFIGKVRRSRSHVKVNLHRRKELLEWSVRPRVRAF